MCIRDSSINPAGTLALVANRGDKSISVLSIHGTDVKLIDTVELSLIHILIIVDVDAHHYEGENYDEFLPYMENDVLRQLAMSGRMKGMARANVTPAQVGYQDMGGRVTRYPLRSSEKTEGGAMRDVQLGHRWMDAMSVDYSCLFPTGMLNIGMHPQKEMEVELCWACLLYTSRCV